MDSIQKYKKYETFSNDQLIDIAEERGMGDALQRSRKELLSYLIETEKTSIKRLVLLFYLIRNSKHGVTREDIYKRMGLMKLEKEASRAKELERALSDISYFSDIVSLKINKEYNNYKAEIILPKTDKTQENRVRDIISMLEKMLFPLDDENTPSEIFSIHVTAKEMFNIHYVNELLKSVITETLIKFTYKGSPFEGVCLGLCVDHNKLYAFIAVKENWYKLTFRVDLFDTISAASLLGPQKVTDIDVSEMREILYKKIKKSNNIFVNLNKEKDFYLKFRFFRSLKAIENDIPGAYDLNLPDIKDTQTVDLKVRFSGREEAFDFMKRWLGSYAVIDGQWFTEFFKSQMEEHLDNLDI